MTEPKLIDYYVRTYDRFAMDLRPIDLREFPRDRFEACVHAMSKAFLGGNILELASDNGRLALGMKQAKIPFTAYTASEFSEARCTALRPALSQHADFSVTVMDAENIPASNGVQYDAVLMVALIEHLLDPIVVMQKLSTFVKKGGFVYIDTPNIAKYTRRLKLLSGYFPSTASKEEGLTSYEDERTELYDEGHLHYFTFRSLSRLLIERCGYSRVEKCPYFHIASTSFVNAPIGSHLARLWPGMFSELAVLAYK